ncbi:MAG: hypothetical protein KGM15_08740 [Pseudomonadota bacterium]|nr:hypothetical protein [Pseudomonadota bacterium]
MIWRTCIGVAVLALAGCAPDEAQLGETYLFNRPAAKIRACFGPPDQRIPVGVEQIWVYRVGRLRVEGWLPAVGADERATFSAPDGDCEARFTIDSHGVRGIAYADSRGRPLPQGERCEIAVRQCLERSQ